MSLIGTWLELPVMPQLLALAGFYIATTIIIHLLSFQGFIGRWMANFKGIVGPFFTSVTLVFGLLTGFVASEVWHRNAEAKRIVRAEADTLLSLYYLAPETSPDAVTIHRLIRAYAESVVQQEWKQMQAGKDAPATVAALDALFREVLSGSAPGATNPGAITPGAINGAVNPAVERARIDTALTLRTTRSSRLWLSEDRTDELKWAILLILAVIAQCAIAAVHLEKRGPQLAALTIFAATVVIALGLVAIQERPFVAPLEVSPAPLEKVLRTIPAG